MMSGGSPSRKETIRPSAKALNDLATYDADSLEWPASANVARGAPPPLVSGKGKWKDQGAQAAADGGPQTQRATPKSVRIAPASENEVRYYEPPPRQREPAQLYTRNGSGPSRSYLQDDEPEVEGDYAGSPADIDGMNSDRLPSGRFQLPLDGGEDETEAQSGLRGAPSLPIIGGVQERPSRNRKAEAQSDGAALPKPSSRFKAMRQAEKEGGKSDGDGASRRPRAPPNLKPPSSVLGSRASPSASSMVTPTPAPSRDPGVLQAGDEEGDWLDEEGNIMSAFRKARFVKQGLGPPGGYSMAKKPAASAKATDEEDEAEPEGQGDMASLMKAISKENEDKLRGMKQEDVAQDLKDLESLFGKDMLEELRKRKQGGKSQTDEKPDPPQMSAALTAPKATPSEPLAPEALNAVAGRADTTPSDLDYIVVDATGALLPVPTDTKKQVLGPENAYLPDELDPSEAANEGYSLPSVLLFARSAIAAQRTMALNMLHRVCSRFPASIAYPNASEDRIRLVPGTIPDAAVAATHLYKASYHLDTALTSIFLLSDRQRSVRSAALSCLRTALLFGPFSADTPIAKESHSVSKRLIDAKLLTGLGNLLRGDEAEQKASRELIVRILLQLVQLDASVADTLLTADRGRFLETLVQTSLRVAWPCTKEGSITSMRPVPACVSLLIEIIRSSRSNAQRLIKSDLLEPVLRFVAVQPWTLDADESSLGLELLELALHAYRELARYGSYASLVSRAWDVFAPIHIWAVSRIQQDLSRSEACIVASFYELLASWTVCAIDPHQTTPEHEVTWSQAESWIDFTMDTLNALVAQTSSSKRTLLSPLAAVLAQVEAWLDGAQRNAPAKRAEVLTQVQALLGGASELQPAFLAVLVLPDLDQALEDDGGDDEEDTSSEGIGGAEMFATACAAASSIIRLDSDVGSGGFAAPTLSRGQDLLTNELLYAYLKEATISQRQRVLDFSCLAADSSADTSLRGAVLGLLSTLQAGEESFAVAFMRTLGNCFSAADDEMKSLFQALTPFFLECVGIRPNEALEAKRSLLSPPPKSTPGDLKRTMSLCLPTLKHAASSPSGDDGVDDEEAEVEKDPITGTLLWRCPASGLPLRPDWPLLALDDLLRSAEATVFNRKDNLPADWDPNERQVVQASLAFAAWCFERQQVAPDSDVPSVQSAHLYLAAQKVFMLESGIQGDIKKWTGAVTGKDLFRDPAIVPGLKRLLSIADALARSEAQAIAAKGDVSANASTLEDLAIAHFGPETTYYSFYTDLVGLYDSISFGDALFALSLLPPTAAAYPADYRRLLWRDYAHLLPTLRMRVEDAPGGVGSYLARGAQPRRDGERELQDKEKEDRKAVDEDLLQAYASALASQPLTAESHPLLFRIALSHLAAYLWREEEDDGTDGTKQSGVADPLAAALAQTFFSPHAAARGVAASVSDTLLRYDVKTEQKAGAVGGPELPLVDEGDDEVARRRKWVEGALGSGSREA